MKQQMSHSIDSIDNSRIAQEPERPGSFQGLPTLAVGPWVAVSHIEIRIIKCGEGERQGGGGGKK